MALLVENQNIYLLQLRKVSQAVIQGGNDCNKSNEAETPTKDEETNMAKINVFE